MTTQEQRAEWSALAQAATPGEWATNNEEHFPLPFYLYVDSSDGLVAIAGSTVTGRRAEANAAFIAAAREAVPALLADVDALTQERDEYRTAYLNEQKLSGSYHVLWQTQEDDIARLTAELASYKRQAAYISSVIDSEGKYVP